MHFERTHLLNLTKLALLTKFSIKFDQVDWMLNQRNKFQNDEKCNFIQAFVLMRIGKISCKFMLFC